MVRGASYASFLLAMLAWSLGSLATAEPLTLEAAAVLARERAPQIAAHRAALESAQQEAISAGRLPDPELVFGVDNAPIEGADAYSLGADFMTMRKVGVMQSFPNGRKRTSERERAAARIAVARNEQRQAELDSARAAADAWIGVHVAERTLAQLEALAPEAQLQAHAARAALASGRGDASAALAAQGAIAELEDQTLAAKRDVRQARVALARWIGAAAEAPLGAPPDFDQPPYPRERLLSALTRHASVRALDARVDLARSEVSLARAAKRPDWSVQLAYADRGDAFDDMASLEFRVGLPLFASTRQSPLVEARRAALTQLEAEREAELRMHEAEIATVLAAWETARERIALYERERLPLARQRSQAALAALQAGRGALSEVLASRIAEIELRRAYTQLELELGRAWAYLRYLEPEHASP